MSDMDTMLLQPFRRMLAEIASPEAVRAAETSRDVRGMRDAIQKSGFLDALLPEDQGGAGLTLPDIFPLVAETGAFCLPIPFAETMVARAFLNAKGHAAPEDALIVLAPPSPIVPLAGIASHALVQNGDCVELVVLNGEGGDPFGALGSVGRLNGQPLLNMEAKGQDLMVFAAGLTAAKMVGAMRRLLDMSLRYAAERQQFGRSLGKFQSIQHQLAVMAEQVVSATVAAQIGMSDLHFDPLKVALGKCRAGEASHQVCGISHAVHGAIGVTEEYDLQLLTRRLKQWALAFGSESYWAERLGAVRMQVPDGTSADFVRTHLQAGGNYRAF